MTGTDMLQRKVPVFASSGKVLFRIKLRVSVGEVRKKVGAKVAFDASGYRFGKAGWVVLTDKEVASSTSP